MCFRRNPLSSPVFVSCAFFEENIQSEFAIIEVCIFWCKSNTLFQGQATISQENVKRFYVELERNPELHNEALLPQRKFEQEEVIALSWRRSGNTVFRSRIRTHCLYLWKRKRSIWPSGTKVGPGWSCWLLDAGLDATTGQMNSIMLLKSKMASGIMKFP